MSDKLNHEEMIDYGTENQDVPDADTAEDMENKSVDESSDLQDKPMSPQKTPRKSTSKKVVLAKVKEKKPVKIALRVLVLVVLFCVVVFAGIIVSDMFFGNNTTQTGPEIIAITVSGDKIILNEDSEVTFAQLREYLDDANNKDELATVALINDTSNPADVTLYNDIVDLLSEYGIVCDKMEPSDVPGGDSVSTADEPTTT